MSTRYSLRVIRVHDPVSHNKLFLHKNLYVTVALGDTVQRSRAIKANFSPAWNTTFALTVPDTSATLTIQLMHNSIFSNSTIGFINITLADLFKKCVYEETAQIELQRAPHKGKTVTTRAGILLLQLQGGSDLFKSLAALCCRMDVFVDAIDPMSEIHPFVNLAWQVVSSLYRSAPNQLEAEAVVMEVVQAMNEAFHFVDEVDLLRKKTQSLHLTVTTLLKQTAECCIFIRECSSHSSLECTLDQSEKTKLHEFIEPFVTLKRNIDSGTNYSAALISARTSEIVDDLYLLRDRLDPRQTNAFSRPLCLSGTRNEIIEEIIAWALSESEQNMFLLSGVAGTGKSTISATVATYFSGISRHASLLFFERAKSDPRSVIRTIAYELAIFDSSIGKRVIAAIEEDSNTATTSVMAQFERLLLQPLVAASIAMRGPILIILNALDECGPPESRCNLLMLLAKTFRILPKNFRFLITSRPEPDIKNALFSQPDFIRVLDIDYASEANRDAVHLYIRVEMGRVIRDELQIIVPEEWCWDKKMRLLGNAAEGLFIWASTAIKFVSSSEDEPFERLERLVENVKSLNLQTLYATILSSGVSWQNPQSKTRFWHVLGLLLFSKVPLTVDVIDGILGYPPESSSRSLLAGLKSVLDYSIYGPVRLFHASFSDYLLHPGYSNEPWFIDGQKQKKFLARRCFDIMKESLVFNICNLESSHISNDSVLDLTMHVETCITQHLSYACLFWAQHLREAAFSYLLMEQLEDFLYQRVLYWLEVLSLLQRLARFHSIFLDATEWTPSDRTDILAFLTDAQNLISIFYEAISQATPHIYISVLPLSPASSKLAGHYLRGASSLVNVSRIGHERSPTLLKTMIGHTDWVMSVAFSPDGTRLASGSADKIIRVWNAVSGKLVAGPFDGHADGVRSVSFSPDGVCLASGSDDRTIRVWDANSGELVAGPFEGHIDGVTSVAFSPDGVRLASGSYDRTIRVWDAGSGVIVAAPFEGHTGGVRSVAFSPDGARLASGSDDKTIRVWDTRNGEVVAGPFEGHIDGVMSVAFSREGVRVASGSADKTIRVWDSKIGEVVAGPFEGHTDGVTSVIFSPDGARLASGSVDKTIRVWDARSGVVVAAPFEGHTGGVRSVAFSPDGARLASGSDDRTIRVWDAATFDIFTGYVASARHTEMITSVALSPDGARLASGSVDKTIRVWDARSGEVVAGPFEGHTDGVTSVAFSPEGARVASGSDDKTIRVWDARSGEVVAGPFEGHTNEVTSVAFNPDGERLASGSYDRTIRMWNAISGEVVAGPFKGHTGGVTSVIFSPDGARLASGSDDKTIRVWDARNGEVVAGPFEGHTNEVTSVAFSPDGERLASGSYDSTIRVWDAISGELVAGPFEGHAGIVTSVVFSPTGILLASGSFDKTIRIWDVDVGSSSAAIGIDGSSHLIQQSKSNLNWSVDESGWLKSGDDLLLWIPPFLRDILCRPQNTAILSCPFYVKLDFSSAALGTEWQKCFKPGRK